MAIDWIIVVMILLSATLIVTKVKGNRTKEMIDPVINKPEKNKNPVNCDKGNKTQNCKGNDNRKFENEIKKKTTNNTKNDRVYLLPEDQAKILTQVKEVIRMAPANTNVTWFNPIEKLINEANYIYRYTNSPCYIPAPENREYFKRLYQSSVEAGKKLETAENYIGNMVLKMHTIRFSDISGSERQYIDNLQKTLPKLQSVVCKYKSLIWNNTHILKICLQKCSR